MNSTDTHPGDGIHRATVQALRTVEPEPDPYEKLAIALYVSAVQDLMEHPDNDPLHLQAKAFLLDTEHCWARFFPDLDDEMVAAWVKRLWEEGVKPRMGKIGRRNEEHRREVVRQASRRSYAKRKERKERSQKICSAPECENKVWTQGLCNKHYAQVRKHGHLTPDARRGRPSKER